MNRPDPLLRLITRPRWSALLVPYSLLHSSFLHLLAGQTSLSVMFLWIFISPFSSSFLPSPISHAVSLRISRERSDLLASRTAETYDLRSTLTVSENDWTFIVENFENATVAIAIVMVEFGIDLKIREFYCKRTLASKFAISYLRCFWTCEQIWLQIRLQIILMFYILLILSKLFLRFFKRSSSTFFVEKYIA